MNTETTDRFAVFILTHGRPDRVITYNTLQKQGYTGEVYIIIDNEDKAADKYRERFGDKVIIFDKLAISKTFDTGDNFGDRRTIVYARNACFGIAKELGLDYFLQLDDDYTEFRWKYTAGLVAIKGHRIVKDIDRLLVAMLAYYQSIDALSIAFGQGGDFLGGVGGRELSRLYLKRKCMNSFFCSTARPFQFLGRVNEDVNTYCALGNRGALMFTVYNAGIEQVTTQAGSGGMTNVYQNEGTYIKSFYPVIYAPSCVKVTTMRSRQSRLHHRIKWDNAVPCILDEKWRKLPRTAA